MDHAHFIYREILLTLGPSGPGSPGSPGDPGGPCDQGEVLSQKYELSQEHSISKVDLFCTVLCGLMALGPWSQIKHFPHIA